MVVVVIIFVIELEVAVAKQGGRGEKVEAKLTAATLFPRSTLRLQLNRVVAFFKVFFQQDTL